jgi:trimethylamine--corrinoid protein Co-methyltransferase
MTAHSNDCDIFNVNMAKVAGTETIVGPNPSPPLTYGAEAIEALYRAAANDCPLRFGYTGEVMGATSPATIVGTVVTGSATVMAGIVLAQLIKPGIRISVGGWAFPQNMRSGLIIFGSIEQSLFHAAHSQYWRSLHMPVNHTTGFTNSKSIDFQCAYEKATQTLISVLAGANIIQVSGAIFGELTLHPVQMILDDDLSNMIGRFAEGIEVTDETLALELINEVGPIPGMYLDKEHTRKWWKKEQYMPKAVDRLGIPEWIAKGKKSAIDYAQKRMEEILATHKPAPLTPRQEEEIDRILAEAREYYRERAC